MESIKASGSTHENTHISRRRVVCPRDMFKVTYSGVSTSVRTTLMEAVTDRVQSIFHVPLLAAPSCPSDKGLTFHPIHRSIGVSRSASRVERSKAGAEKASFTPSKRPICNLLELVGVPRRVEKHHEFFELVNVNPLAITDVKAMNAAVRFVNFVMIFVVLEVLSM